MIYRMLTNHIMITEWYIRGFNDHVPTLLLDVSIHQARLFYLSTMHSTQRRM